ncbi:MAG: hypothetical protein JNK82_44970 [Myxococcaceae bacterium]|nr:hypothetical protein [Myxococcaceae bacterium]
MTVQETLLKFSRREVGPNDVMRALCEHDGFFAPAGFAVAATKSDTYDRVSLWGAESKVRPGHLYLFTDRGAADAAATKVQLGPYVSTVLGSLLFRALPGSVQELHVNPGSPKEQGWWMAGDALPLAGLWGQAVTLEAALSGKRKTDVVTELLDFPGLITYDTERGMIATLQNAGGLTNPGMLFTSIDCADAAIAKFGEQAKGLKQVVLSGAEVFAAFPKLGIDGFLVNPFGPGPVKIFDASLCGSISEAAAARKAASK